MKYRYTTVLSVRGVLLPPATDCLNLIQDLDHALSAFLVADPHPWSADGDRGLALASMILDGRFGRTSDADMSHAIDEIVEQVRAARREEYGTGPFLVVAAEGEVTAFEPSHQVEREDFVVCFDGVDKDGVIDSYVGARRALCNAFACATEKVSAIREVAESVVLIRDDGKLVYSFTAKVGSMRAYLSRPLAADDLELARGIYPRLLEETALSRVQRLVESSLKNDGDDLRSFLAAWTAIEVLINKISASYATSVLEQISHTAATHEGEACASRLRQLMKGRPGLALKLAAISARLARGDLCADLDAFMEAKRRRDSFVHGDDIDERTLPTATIRTMACKYLRLHVERIGSELEGQPNNGIQADNPPGCR